jgi:DNA-binding NarL/FixJ family response regulator
MLRILIADDHEVVRKGLERILGKEFPDAYIEAVKDGQDMLGRVFKEEWDLVISDLSMPSKTGLEALAEIKQYAPKLPVLILTMHPEEQYAMRAIKAGASGYLSKDMDSTEIIAASRRVLMGRKYITPTLAERLSEFLESPDSEFPHEALSTREFEVLKLLATGKSLVEIGNSLSITPATVSTYRARILGKMNLHNNADLIRYAISHKLID